MEQEKLSASFFYVLEKSIKSYRQMAQRNIALHEQDITVDQLLVLQTMSDHPGITQQQIGEAVFKDYASITRIIDLLVRKGLLNRSGHPTDRRRSDLTISPQGEELLKMFYPVIWSNRKTALDGVTSEQLQLVKNVLLKITDNCAQ